jgi:hypothetical protein
MKFFLSSKCPGACFEQDNVIFVRTWAIRVALAEAVATRLVPEALLFMCNPVTCCWLQQVTMAMNSS